MINLNDFELEESGIFNLQFGKKFSKTKNFNETQKFIENLFVQSDINKIIEDGVFIIKNEEKVIELDCRFEEKMGTSLYFSKENGYLGKGTQNIIVELPNNKDKYEKFIEKEAGITDDIETEEKNKNNIRLESIYEWLEVNKNKNRKKNPIKINDKIEKIQNNSSKSIKKSILQNNSNGSIKKRRRNELNHFLNKIKKNNSVI